MQENLFPEFIGGSFVALNQAAIDSSFDDPANAPRNGGSIKDPRGRRIVADCQLAVAHFAKFHRDAFGPMSALRFSRLIPSSWTIAHTQGEHHYAAPEDFEFRGQAGVLYQNLCDRVRELEHFGEGDADARDLVLIWAMRRAAVLDRYRDAEHYPSSSLAKTIAQAHAKIFVPRDRNVHPAAASPDISPAYLDRMAVLQTGGDWQFWMRWIGPAKPIGDFVCPPMEAEDDAGIALQTAHIKENLLAGLTEFDRTDYGFMSAIDRMEGSGRQIHYRMHIFLYHRPSITAWIAENAWVFDIANDGLSGADRFSTDPDAFVDQMIARPAIKLDNERLAPLADLYGILFSDPRFDAEFSATPIYPKRGMAIPAGIKPFIGSYRSPHMGLPFLSDEG